MQLLFSLFRSLLITLTLIALSGPATARFLSVDPAPVDPNNGDNFNRYWYANNNPYKYVDPDGRQAADRFSNDFARMSPQERSEVGEFALGIGVAVATEVAVGKGFGLLLKAANWGRRTETVMGLPVGRTPAQGRANLEAAGYPGKATTNKTGTETGTIHHVPEHGVDVRVMDGGPRHGPRIVTSRKESGRDYVQASDGQRFKDGTPQYERRAGSHIYYKTK
jgi:hypothetical protein